MLHKKFKQLLENILILLDNNSHKNSLILKQDN